MDDHSFASLDRCEVLYTERMEGKYADLPNSAKEFEDMLFEFADVHQHRGIATASTTPQKRKRRRHIRSESREESEERIRKHKKSRRTLDAVEEGSYKRLFRSSQHKTSSEPHGGKTRIYSGPEMPAVSDCDEKKNSVPFDTHSECPVAVEEEVIMTSAIQEFCNDQTMSDVSMTLQDILDRATSVPDTPSVQTELKEQEDDIVLAFSKVASTNLYSSPTIVGHLNMVKYWASKQTLETLNGPYLNTMYKELGLMYLTGFHETFARGIKCVVSSVHASMMYNTTSDPITDETYRVSTIFSNRIKEVCSHMSKEDFRKKVIVFTHGVNKGKFNTEDWTKLVNLW